MLRLFGGSTAALVALLLLRAALHKLADPARVGGVLADYELFPEGALKPLRGFVPAFELAIAAMLAFGVTQAAGAWAASGLMMAYGGAVAVNLTRGRTEIDCGCGSLPEPLSWGLVARNGLLSTMLLPAGLQLGSLRTPGEIGIGWAVALATLMCWVAIEQLLANAARMRRDGDLWLASAFGGGR